MTASVAICSAFVGSSPFDLSLLAIEPTTAPLDASDFAVCFADLSVSGARSGVGLDDGRV